MIPCKVEKLGETRFIEFNSWLRTNFFTVLREFHELAKRVKMCLENVTVLGHVVGPLATTSLLNSLQEAHFRMETGPSLSFDSGAPDEHPPSANIAGSLTLRYNQADL